MTTIYKRKLYRSKPIKLNWFDLHPYCSGMISGIVIAGLIFLALGV